MSIGSKRLEPTLALPCANFKSLTSALLPLLRQAWPRLEQRAPPRLPPPPLVLQFLLLLRSPAKKKAMILLM